MRRWSAVAWVVALVVAGAAGWTAGRATFVPPQAEEAVAAVQLFTVAEDTVGSSIGLTAVAQWVSAPLVGGDVAGKVTSLVAAPGAVVDQGDVLLTVDLRPVVVAAGEVPAFRSLDPSIEGPDVAQLQQMLIARGHLTGTADGRFGSSTTQAVRAWQKALGVPVTGVVTLGDVVFVPELPVRVTFEDEVVVGATLAPGDAVLRAVEPTPTFTLRVSPDQRSVVPEVGALVRLMLGDAMVDAVIGSARTADDGSLVLTLSAPDGGPVCPGPCDAIPFDAQEHRVPATVLITPEVTGPAVPLSALATAAGGAAYVTLADGSRTAVTVRAQDGSRAVVDGIAAGTSVRLFSEGTGADVDAPSPDEAGPATTEPTP
ncbi:peptidoglycan-binding protein [Cellulomonas sp. P22]|uniref:peptidoglycan-binding protein n=1 Tax=Cellulomonas sp. P22 TaxID=3373189 RepID=UPI0037BA68A9